MRKSELAKDFRALSMILASWGKVKNPAVLNSISFHEGSDVIKYSIPKTKPLIFLNAEIDRHCLPTGIEKLPDTEIEIQLTTLHEEAIIYSEKFDPIKSLGVNVIIDARYIIRDTYGEATCSWHLDKHNGSPSDYFHPLYHINFGGDHMSSLPENFGNLLLLNAPRILHPPMDILLSCDFIIRNFYSKKNNRSILENASYKAVMNNAKVRYWKPFAMALMSEWNAEMKVDNLPFSYLHGQ